MFRLSGSDGACQERSYGSRSGCSFRTSIQISASLWVDPRLKAAWPCTKCSYGNRRSSSSLSASLCNRRNISSSWSTALQIPTWAHAIGSSGSRFGNIGSCPCWIRSWATWPYWRQACLAVWLECASRTCWISQIRTPSCWRLSCFCLLRSHLGTLGRWIRLRSWQLSDKMIQLRKGTWILGLYQDHQVSPCQAFILSCFSNRLAKDNSCSRSSWSQNSSDCARP